MNRLWLGILMRSLYFLLKTPEKKMIGIRVYNRLYTLTDEMKQSVKDYLANLEPEQFWEHDVSYRILYGDDYTEQEIIEMLYDIESMSSSDPKLIPIGNNEYLILGNEIGSFSVSFDDVIDEKLPKISSYRLLEFVTTIEELKNIVNVYRFHIADSYDSLMSRIDNLPKNDCIYEICGSKYW
jgi:hypothetical protein